MSSSKKSETSRTITGQLSNKGDIVDTRFVAAATRPQFSSGRKNYKKNDKSCKNGVNSNDDAKGGNLITNHNSDPSEKFGDSLTRAIQSDSRFADALTNPEKFGCVPLMDKYGRKKERRQKQADNKRINNDQESEKESEKEKVISKAKDDIVKERNDIESRIVYLNALSRGEITISSSDEECYDSNEAELNDTESSDHESDDDNSSSKSIDVYGKAGVLDPSFKQLPGDDAIISNDNADEVEATDSLTPYLAILNLDWAHVRAVDVYAMLNSFCPPGALKKVEVYPSNFGREMMRKEIVEGPNGLWKKAKKKDAETYVTERSDGSDCDSENTDDRNSDSVGENIDYLSENDNEEDLINLNDATVKLYSHFPPQSHAMKTFGRGGNDSDDEGFDQEKLRAYEAAKLRYYFAIATFSNSSAAESVYNAVDGIEMEHSAAAIDIRALPADRYFETIEGRELRDECNHLPGKYAPPETVVAALCQSKVSCSWETGDEQRERKLTRYGMGKDAWQALAEGDDIKLYLGSDNSSVEERGSIKGVKTSERMNSHGQLSERKGAKMRAKLGLSDSDDDDDTVESESNKITSDINKNEDHFISSADSDSEEEEDLSTKKITFIPGKGSLEEKIRSKLRVVGGLGEELPPFQKYLEKRKEKRRERRQSARNKSRGLDKDNDDDNDGMYEQDPEFGIAEFSDEDSDKNDHGKESKNFDFFLEGDNDNQHSGKSKSHFPEKQKQKETQHDDHQEKAVSSKEELELLIAGDYDEENLRDYDMRGLVKLEKYADKKLKGKRKRKVEALIANVSGKDFQIDTGDKRFSAMFEGDDRFGIDQTNPSFKKTVAMRTLLGEQSKRRNNRTNTHDGMINGGNTSELEKSSRLDNDNGGWVESNSGGLALSSLVKDLQQKIS